MIKIKLYSVFTILLMLPLATLSHALAQENDADDIAGPVEQTVPVAEDDTQALAASAPTEEQLLEEFARYRRLFNDGILDEADIAAKRIIEMAIRIYGPQSRETANALNNLGIVQHSNGQFDAAIQNFTSAVEIIEVVEDRLNSTLVNPLKGLGAAQLSNGRPDQARKTYTRAAHITQVNEGPHNLQQIEILESVAETFIRSGDTKAARQILDRIHILNVKHFDKNPLGLLPSLMNRANWQHRAGYYDDERVTYRRAIRIIEGGGEKENPLLVEPLRRLGESFYYINSSSAPQQYQGVVSSGEIYFKRAVRIAEKAEDFDWNDLAITQIALADYLVNAGSNRRASKIYLQVWEDLSTDDVRLGVRDEMFRDPVAIRTDRLPQFAGSVQSVGSTSDALLTGEVIVDYIISDRGELRELQSLVKPTEFSDMQKMVHRELRRRVYRPRLVDGVPVQAENVRFVHTFSYLQSDLDMLRAANPQPEKPEETSGEAQTVDDVPGDDTDGGERQDADSD
jgi:tetratricopeptide (TPR) repeat protein